MNFDDAEKTAGGFYLLLSNENHGDQRFIDKIENNIF